MIYYLIQSYKKDVDEEYKRHLYPCYLTSYDMKIGGKGFGLQSGTHDALKFTNQDLLKPYLKKAEEIFGNTHEFDVVPFDKRVFGRAKIFYVIES